MVHLEKQLSTINKPNNKIMHSSFIAVINRHRHDTPAAVPVDKPVDARRDSTDSPTRGLLFLFDLTTTGVE